MTAGKTGIEAVYDGLEWRFIGPYRGGRAVAVAGVEGDPLTYYMGTAGGGVWKTTNAGNSWFSVSDTDFNVGTIGAVAVAQSDPNVVYVGTGESTIRGVTTSHGDGVYKSTDAGSTWTHIGLEDSRQVSAVVINPNDADTVFVAAQGNPWGANETRGIFKSSDGGATWRHVLKVDADTGASDLEIDPTNPRILYAALWNHRRNPWFVHSGGESGGIYKSVDGGENWTELEGGLPKNVGNIGVAVAPSNPGKVYAIVEAAEGGLYVSTDAGENWSNKNDSNLVRARAWYYSHVMVDPLDEDTVYLPNGPILKSIDGGETFEALEDLHGDGHDMWFNPADSKNFAIADDGGIVVTLDGGASWSSLYNQPTAQFYRVTTDNLRPYSVYGGQQDNSSLAIRSDDADGSIGRDDYTAVGGGESASISFDPDNPKLIYATSINATLTEYDAELERTREIKPYPEYTFANDPRNHRYRFNWNAPVQVSPHDPEVIYHGAHVLLKSTDRGMNWEEVSPDLTRNDPEKQGLGGGPFTNEQAGAENYNTILYIKESQHEQGVIWVGSDDGLVHLTRDGGENWINVTPRGVGEAHINSIEVSPHYPETAYLAVTGYKMNDFAPYIYVTRNYGQSWDRIDRGLPEEAFVRAIREDTERPGLLYAGTEAGAFVSFDGGRDGWNILKLNMPPVTITDMEIRQNDLVVSTQGRGFWILGRTARFAAGGQSIADETLHLFAPEPAIRSTSIAEDTGSGDPTAEGKQRGAIINYYVSKGTNLDGETFTIDILNDAGEVVRQYSSEETATDECRVANAMLDSPPEIERPEPSAGLNRWVWDLHHDPLYCPRNVRLSSGFYGFRVMPGNYRVRVSLGSVSADAPIVVLKDPNIDTSQAQFEELSEYLDRTSALFAELMRSISNVRAARTQIQTQMTLTADHANSVRIKSLGNAAIEEINAWENTVTSPQREASQDEIRVPNRLDAQIRYLISVLDMTGAPVIASSKERLADLESMWSERQRALTVVGEGAIAAFNRVLVEVGIPHVPLPQGT